MYRRPYAVYLNAIAALIATLLLAGAIVSGSFKGFVRAEAIAAPAGFGSIPSDFK